MAKERIISLVPSITLTLFDLGAGNRVVGRTKFCIHPKDKVEKVPVVGGTKKINIDKIRELNPDLIIANIEENEKEQVEALKKEFDVLVTDVKDLEDNYNLLLQLGKITATTRRANEIILATQQEFSELRFYLENFARQKIPVLYLIWKDPYMSIGHDTFIHAMLQTMGLDNVFANKTRYPEVEDISKVAELNCHLVFLSSEPYPFTEKHIPEIQEKLPEAKIVLVNGEYFSWYGSRMVDAPNYFRQLLSA